MSEKENFNVNTEYEEIEETITDEVEETEEGKLTPEESEKFKAIMARIYNCYPKKTYTNEYRKKRQLKNKMAKKSRRNNRKSNG